MNELQIFFPTRDDYYCNWIYFKTNATTIREAIEHFKETLKYSGIDLCDMQPEHYNLWDKNSDLIDDYLVQEGETI